MTNIYARNAQDRLSLGELDLYHRIMAYRAAEGLDAIPLSAALTTTAGRHVADTRDNIWGDDGLAAGSNLHSWSDAPYDARGRTPEAMWEAPARLGTGYDGAGYEITAAGMSDPKAALDIWKGSPAHDALLTNTGMWSALDFEAIGIGFDVSPGPGPYAGRVFHVWFGTEPDESGAPLIRGTRSDDAIRGTLFDDEISGQGGNDRIAGRSGDDRLRGDAGDDRLDGGSGDDRLLGNGGGDRLAGGANQDRLYGGSGRDRLDGGNGADLLDGGAGADVLTGGRGADIFRFTAAATGAVDRITDFDRGADHIDLGRLAASLPGRADGFDFIEARGFSDSAGEVRFAGRQLRVDLDGDGSAELRIALDDVGRLGGGDLILG